MDGAFEASLKGIRLCRDLGLKIGVRFTMTQDNAHDLPELLKLVSEAVRDSDLTPEQQDDVGAGVVVAIAAWATAVVASRNSE